MNVVGKVGSLISQGVYSVATPFHPFGGAVDIIVVEQEDGTYRSTPWYVRFGKFQGIIKGAEKVVTITVNGVDANFHMFLDSSGQAYFMREVVGGSDDQEIVSNHQENEHNHLESVQDENFKHPVNDHGEHVQDDEETSPSKRFNNYHYRNLEEVEDVVKSSNDINSEMVLVSVDGHVLTAPISANEKNTDDLQLDTPQFHLGPGEGTGQEFVSGGDIWEDGLFVPMDACASKEEDASGNILEGRTDYKRVSFHNEQAQSIYNYEGGSSSEEIAAMIDNGDMFKSCLDLTLHLQERDNPPLGNQPQDSTLKNNSKHSPNSSSCTAIVGSEASTINDEVEILNPGIVEMKDVVNSFSADFKQSEIQICSDVNLYISDQPYAERLNTLDNVAEASEDILAADNMKQISVSETSVDPMSSSLEHMNERLELLLTDADNIQINHQGLESNISPLGFEISLCGNILRPGMSSSAAAENFDAHRISEDEFKDSGQSIIKSGNLVVRCKEMYLPWDKAAHIVLGKAIYGPHFSCEIKDSIPINTEEMTVTREDAQIASPSSNSSSRRWRLWPNPFRRDRTLKHSNSDSSNEDLFVDTESDLQTTNADQNPSNRSPRKVYFRTYIPTTEQIASLSLKDGQNMVAFSFSTRVLGKQQVDAHIYLWKWNARIVISDVDGTITKSDVLGQVMPLVGKDWTQSGVARLFSAIKENGYQVLFLSARAIVQAYLTRSFLLNLKQDGKALPSGPVVISPDGLFPSLYREVIRRAPHEFKIACLEDIRALFPSDYNPFYAGFGNRDTDELSYRKIGIAKGKIFIINPKGEVAINHCIDVKSYTSLHTMVNDMFPPTSLVEQEDYNSWNFWRMPLPSIDL